MAKKYYAVKAGLTPGIYFSWADCEKNVKGYPKAVYKSFATLGEAEAFINGTGGSAQSEPSVTDGEESRPALTESQAVAYVDGSYHKGTKEYACGVVLFHGQDTEYFSQKFSDLGLAAMRNVAGEIEGSMCAMRYCLEHQIGSLTIYYDYEGIEKWCTGAWKANKEGTIAYREFYRQASGKMDIRFVKVKGHSGDRYNDMADSLARRALGLEE